MIVDVTAGGPAEKAGLEGGDRQLQVGNLLFTVGGDIITQVDQHRVNNAEDLMPRI